MRHFSERLGATVLQCLDMLRKTYLCYGLPKVVIFQQSLYGRSSQNLRPRFRRKLDDRHSKNCGAPADGHMDSKQVIN